ncbi:MAG: ISAzo13 family transposase, partial [Myxococcota bacterium]|nr:ISAzo13 family transposase [Myxococcota bacterium]
LESYETILNFIRTTKTKTGLAVTATLLEGDYPIGVKTSEAQMAELHLHRHHVLPMWNYTLVPAPARKANM